MTNSTDKMKVMVTNTPYGKRWVKVKLKHSKEFYPSFEDLHRIIQAICYCEDEKYPNGEGRDMVQDFLWDCVYEEDYDVLAIRYRIPIREGTNILKTNGAKLKTQYK